LPMTPRRRGRTSRSGRSASPKLPRITAADRETAERQHLRRVLVLLEHPQRSPADGFIVLGVGLHRRVRSCCATGRTSAWLPGRPLAVRGVEGGSKVAEALKTPAGGEDRMKYAARTAARMVPAPSATCFCPTSSVTPREDAVRDEDRDGSRDERAQQNERQRLDHDRGEDHPQRGHRRRVGEPGGPGGEDRADQQPEYRPHYPERDLSRYGSSSRRRRTDGTAEAGCHQSFDLRIGNESFDLRI
jgi:hypothetical protein